MNISFPINILLRKNLTADDFVTCMLLLEKKYGLLKIMYKLVGNSMHDRIERLISEGYLAFNGLGTIIPMKEIEVTDKFKTLLTAEDPFEEFYNNYPTSVIRKEGKRDYLRGNKVKCKLRYKRLTDKNILLHNHIIECLQKEIKEKEERNKMGYFKRMLNWIDGEEWKKYEEDETVNDKSLNMSNTYGSDIL